MIVLRAMRRCRGVFAIVRLWMPLVLEAAVTLASAPYGIVAIRGSELF
jgi:hypothetical protein